MAVTVIKTDVGCLITGQPILADLVDLGNGQTVYQLKTSGGGGGMGPQGMQGMQGMQGSQGMQGMQGSAGAAGAAGAQGNQGNQGPPVDPCPTIVDLGTVGATFSPSVVKATGLIRGVIDAAVTMSNLTISDTVCDGELMRIEFTQGATGGDVSSWTGANFVGSDLVPLTSIGLSVGVGKTDIIVLEWNTSRGKWMVVGFFNGVAP